MLAGNCGEGCLAFLCCFTKQSPPVTTETSASTTTTQNSEGNRRSHLSRAGGTEWTQGSSLSSDPTKKNTEAHVNALGWNCSVSDFAEESDFDVVRRSSISKPAEKGVELGRGTMNKIWEDENDQL